MLKLKGVGLDLKLVYILSSDVFNVIFEINRHLFLVLLLLTLSIVFWAKYVVSKVT